MRPRSKPRPLQESDGPLRYAYVSISGVVGLNLPEGSGEVVICDFPNLGSRAVLTKDWDHYARHIDRSNAMGTLLLTGLVGGDRSGRLWRWLRRLETVVLGEPRAFERRLLREAEVNKVARHRKHASSGCYFVYIAEGDLLAPVQLDSARLVGDIGFGFDLISGSSYRDLHRRAVHSTAAALSLALSDTTSSPEIRLLTDAVYLTGPQRLIVYPKSISTHAVGVAIASSGFVQAAQNAAATAPVLMNDLKLNGAVDLFVQSQRKSYDNLRGFIAAWSALELLVNRLARIYEDQFDALLTNGITLPAWDKNLAGVPLEQYRMRDRFFSTACVLDLPSAETDAADFSSINKSRGDYYHTMTVDEKDLPTHRTQRLFRKYLKLALAKAAAENPIAAA